MDEATEASLLLEIDYTPYDNACKDPQLDATGHPMECRLLHGHYRKSGTPHATRAGAGIRFWPAS
jgi:hypothetical protein